MGKGFQFGVKFVGAKGLLSGNGTPMVFLKLLRGESFVSHWERRLIICNRGSIAGILSGLDWVEGLGGPDGPRTLASEGRGISYDSGDEVSVVESGKWTPLDLTSEETSGRGILAWPSGGGGIVWGGVSKREGEPRGCTAQG